jgi:hypothetical protein
MQITGYTDLLAPEDSNAWKGGAVWRWVKQGGGVLHARQDSGGPVYARIVTLEGDMRADIGDWIIRGVAGEFYLCKPDIFAATPKEDDRG